MCAVFCPIFDATFKILNHTSLRSFSKNHHGLTISWRGPTGPITPMGRRAGGQAFGTCQIEIRVSIETTRTIPPYKQFFCTAYCAFFRQNSMSTARKVGKFRPAGEETPQCEKLRVFAPGIDSSQSQLTFAARFNEPLRKISPGCIQAAAPRQSRGLLQIHSAF